MALDGVMMDMPDTAANAARCPKALDGTRQPFPQPRAVGPSACGTHAITAAAFESTRVGEQELANQLTGAVTDGMLVTAGLTASCRGPVRP